MIVRSLYTGSICILLLCLLPGRLRAQANSKWAGFGIEANISAGKVLKHTSKFTAPVPDLSTAFELNFIRQTDGRKAWQQRRHYPIVGWGLTYTSYGIDSIYGKCFSIYPNLELPLIRGKRLEWTLRMGFGLGYVTRRYERAPSWDTINNAIGTHFNNFTTFSTDLRYHVDKHWDIQAGMNFSHISNASFRSPNLGVNMYGAHLGVRYFPVTRKPDRIKNNLSKLNNRWLGQLRAGISANEYGTGDGPLYPIYMASAYLSRRYHSKNKLFAGIDYSYHEGIYAFLRNNEILIGEERENSWKSSVFVGNEFLVGRFGILLQIGIYIKEAYLRQDFHYEKLGANIYLLQRENGILKELSLAVLLKTALFQAELVEMGIGIGF